MNNWSTNLIGQIVAYMLISIVATVSIGFLQYKIYTITKIEFFNFFKPDNAPIMLSQWGPTLGFLMTALIFKDVIFSLNIGLNFSVLKKIGLVVAIPLLLNCIVYFLCHLRETPSLTVHVSEQVLIMGFCTIVLGALGEEIGWRGYLQPLLENKFCPLVASIFVGFLWGCWHIHYLKNGWVYFFSFLLFTISASVIIAWLLRNTDFNIILSMLFHAVINLTFFLLLKDVIMTHRFIITVAVVWLIAAIAIIIIYGSNLYLE